MNFCYSKSSGFICRVASYFILFFKNPIYWHYLKNKTRAGLRFFSALFAVAILRWAHLVWSAFPRSALCVDSGGGDSLRAAALQSDCNDVATLRSAIVEVIRAAHTLDRHAVRIESLHQFSTETIVDQVVEALDFARRSTSTIDRSLIANPGD